MDYLTAFKVTATISGLLKILNGMLFPSPLFIIIVVSAALYFPEVYVGNNPWFGATKPPTNGILTCPPCEKTCYADQIIELFYNH